MQRRHNIASHLRDNLGHIARNLRSVHPHFRKLGFRNQIA